MPKQHRQLKKKPGKNLLGEGKRETTHLFHARNHSNINKKTFCHFLVTCRHFVTFPTKLLQHFQQYLYGKLKVLLYKSKKVPGHHVILMCIFMDVHYCLDQTSLNISKDTFQKTNLHFAKPSIIFVLEYVKMYHKNPCNYKLRPKSTEVQNLSRLYSRNSKKVKKSTFLIS